MNRLREFFGNIPIFQRQVERELEAKGIKPTEGVKKVEHGRQVLKKWLGLGIGLLMILFVGVTYFNNKNHPDTPPAVTKQSTDKRTTQGSSSEGVQGDSDHLLKLSAKERAEEATAAFKSWYKSYANGDVALEINPELLKEGSGGTSPMELQEKLIANLKAKFGDSVSDDFYSSLQSSFNFNPVVVDSAKGLTISKQNDDKSQWLNTWFLDAKQAEKNTQIVLRNDFPYEWVDWRNDARHREAYKNIFTQFDWDNDLSYEVVGINLTESKKNVEGVSIVFVIMHYNDKLGRWQVTGNIGGIV